MFHILNLGAGVNSTHLYLMGCDGEIPMDYAIFADTGEEPRAVYRHLKWLNSQDGPPILTGTAGKLGADLMRGEKSTGQRFASIPAYTAMVEGQPLGRVRRQCTREYKIDVVKRVIRERILRLEPRMWVEKDTEMVQYFGFSLEEQGRACRTMARFREIRWAEPSFPLIDREIKRHQSRAVLEARVPHPVSRSSCVFCPFKSQREWRCLRDSHPAGWERACEVDDALRIPGRVVNRSLKQKLYVHRSCKPLRKAYLGDDQMVLFDDFREDCEGGCGT